MILGGAFEQEGSGGGGTGGTTQYVRRHYKSFKGTNLTVVEGMHQFMSPTFTWLVVLFIILADLILGMVYKTIFRCGIQCVTASWCVIVQWYTMCYSFLVCYCTWIAKYNVSVDRCNHVVIMIVPCRCGALRSSINCKTEIHIAKYNKRGDVVMQCDHH